MKNAPITNFAQTFVPLCLRVSFFLIIFLLTSCATVPIAGTFYEEGSELTLLPAGAALYLWADAVEGRPLLEALPVDLNDRNVLRVMDNTDWLVAAIFPEGHERRFILAALGNYPQRRANFSLTFTRGWSRQRSESRRTYWFSQREGLAIALESNLALVSNITPFNYEKAEIPPPGFMEFRRPMTLAGWVPDSNVLINRVIGSMGIPIQIPAEDLFFGAQAASEEDLWELVMRVRTPSPTAASSILFPINLARGFALWGGALPEIAALLLANPLTQDGDALILRSAALSAERLALLLEMFTLEP